MKQVYKFDQEGRYLEPVMIYPNEKGEYEIPADCTDVERPQPNWEPVFVNGEWIETATEEEKNPPLITNEPLTLEKLEQQQQLMQQALDDLILGGMF